MDDIEIVRDPGGFLSEARLFTKCIASSCSLFSWCVDRQTRRRHPLYSAKSPLIRLLFSLFSLVRDAAGFGRRFCGGAARAHSCCGRCARVDDDDGTGQGRPLHAGGSRGAPRPWRPEPSQAAWQGHLLCVAALFSFYLFSHLNSFSPVSRHADHSQFINEFCQDYGVPKKVNQALIKKAKIVGSDLGFLS